MSVNPQQQQDQISGHSAGSDDGDSTVSDAASRLSSEPAPVLEVARKGWITWPRRHPIVSLVVLVALVGGGYWLSRGEQVANDKPLLSTVSIGNIENTVTAAGKLQPQDYVDVGAQVSGQLEKLFVEVGDMVEQNQLLAQIDATVQVQRVEASKASLNAQQAQLSSRESALDLAQKNVARQEMLKKEDATSEQEYDNALNNLASAKAALDQLREQIKQSSASLLTEEAELGYTKIYAPIAGTVVSIPMKEGQTLNATQQAPTVMRIADLTTMTVETEVSEADVGKLKKGMEVYFTTLGGGERRWYGTLRQILPTPVTTNNVVLYTALFDVKNADGMLLSSMTAQVFFVTSAARNVLTVPLGAVNFAKNNAAAPPAADTGSAMGAVGEGQPGQGFPRGGFGQQGNFDPSQMTPEMRENMRAMRERMSSGGGFDPNNLPADMRERFQQRMAGGDGAAAGSETRPRQATVKVVGANGQIEEREVMVGVTSRVSAQVLSGLKEGEQVIAGVVQVQSQPAAGNNNNMRPPFMRF